MAHIEVVVVQFDVLASAHVRVEDYTDAMEPKEEGVILDYGNELAVYLPDEVAERTLRALADGCPRLSLRCMERVRDVLLGRIAEASASSGQRARLDPGPLP